MAPDPDLTGPPEWQPDEEPSDGDLALWAEAAFERSKWEANLAADAGALALMRYTIEQNRAAEDG